MKIFRMFLFALTLASLSGLASIPRAIDPIPECDPCPEGPYPAV